MCNLKYSWSLDYLLVTNIESLEENVTIDFIFGIK